MSIALMTEAWKAAMPSGRKFVLLSLCDNANDQGECYPSIAMIAQRCSMSARAVQGHIRDLEKVGILTCIERTGRSTIYRIDPRRFCTPANSAPPQNLHPTPAESAPTPPQNLHPTPAESAPITVNEPSIEPSRNPKSKAKLAKPEDVGEQVWADFLEIRKAKKSPLTATALSGIRGEAQKAGMTLEGALAVCCMRGWAGFKAAWVLGSEGVGRDAAGGASRNGGQGVNRQEALEARNRAVGAAWAEQMKAKLAAEQAAQSAGGSYAGA